MTGEEATMIVVVGGILLVLIVIMIGKSKEKAKWRKALRLDPASAYYDRAPEDYDAESGEEKYEHAVVDLTMAIALDPEYADAYLSRGALYDDYGKKNEALADYRKFLELSDYKTAEEALKAKQRHKHLGGGKLYNPLIDPMVVARLSNKSERDWITKRVQELESYVKNGGG